VSGAEAGLKQVLAGEARQGLLTLEAAMDASPSRHWLPLLKQAVDHARRGGGNGPSPDVELERALSKAVSLEPDDWELLCLRGTTRTGCSDFELALEDFDRAVALKPDSPRPYSDRAFLHARLGAWADALADLDRAASRSGAAGAGLSLERGLVLLSLGRAAEARAAISKAASGSRDPEVHYQLGRCLFIEGQAAEALAAVRRALELSGEGSSRRRAYELLEVAVTAFSTAGKARASAPGEAFMRQSRKKAAADGKGCLWLFGIGIDRPYEVTLNTLLALKRCDVVYTQADTREVRELLEAVCPGIHSIAPGGRAKRGPQDEVWSRVREELDRGSQTGYVTYGHPMLFGEGNMMAKRCREAGYAYRVMTAPSSLDGVLTMLQEDLELCERGFSVANARSLLDRPGALDSEKDAIILGINRVLEEGKFGALCDLLEDSYPASHRLYGLKCADGTREESRVPLSVGELRRRERELDPASTFFVPGVGAAAARPARSRRKA
jgi:tetratricopeptide (TPR) repeat protein